MVCQFPHQTWIDPVKQNLWIMNCIRFVPTPTPRKTKWQLVSRTSDALTHLVPRPQSVECCHGIGWKSFWKQIDGCYLAGEHAGRVCFRWRADVALVQRLKKNESTRKNIGYQSEQLSQKRMNEWMEGWKERKTETNKQRKKRREWGWNGRERGKEGENEGKTRGN